MVQCHMYCAEQIVVPDTLPNILKNYAKDAIRTQPYDLLRWSATYFRCLAQEKPLPVKKRLEKSACLGSLTKGYLRILLEQIGKGYYVRRDVLQKKWEGLCLPEDDLFKFLSLCRMFNWYQIHWLKLFAVMVGSLNENIKDTVNMICELLTDDVEGSPNPIPMWMLKITYTFIAELDCSEEQEFIKGRRFLGGSIGFEPEPPAPVKPKILSSAAFRDAVIDEWKLRLDQISVSKDCMELDDQSSVSCSNKSTSKSTSTDIALSAKSSTISTSFKFVGDYNDPHDLIKRSPDYDSIIVLLDEVNDKCLYKYGGPGHVTEKNFEHAKKRELEILEKRDQILEAYHQQAKKLLQEEKLELLREIGPPWTWLHHFASQNCRQKSYNFVEYETLSICSDSTPPESSDESFDFETEKFIIPKTQKKVEEEDINPEYEKLRVVDEIVREVVNQIVDAENEGLVVCSDTSSIYSFMSDKETFGKLNSFVDSKKRIIDFGPLKDYIEEAQALDLQFEDMDELFDYFVSKCQKDNVCGNLLSYKIFGEEIDYNVPDEKEEEQESEQLDIEIEVEDNVSEKIVAPDITVEEPSPRIEEIFIESGIEADKKLLAKKVSESMIIGLADGPECKTIVTEILVEEIVEPAPDYDSLISGVETSKVEIDFSTPVFSDVSSKVSENDETPRKKKVKKDKDPLYCEQPEVFKCIIPPLNGIGKKIPEKIIQDFLTYCKFRSRQQKGMIYPRNFLEKECPYMFPGN